ncbi:MAG: SOS response-associated peptidase [Chryseolinea sp.]
MSDIEYYYSARYSGEMEGACANDGMWSPVYHQFGFDHLRAPVITSRDPGKIQMFSWGLIPYKMSTLNDALSIRGKTLMCRSEEMYDKFSFQELAKAGKRCIIPTSGYFEHHWVDDKGKVKIPYYLNLKHRPFFSLGGLYSRWIDQENNHEYYTYCVCTTDANALAGAVHNQGQRMPVILSNQAAERAWLDSALSKLQVLELCKPIESSMMEAHPVSRLITSRINNVPEAIEPYPYPSALSLMSLRNH